MGLMFNFLRPSLTLVLALAAGLSVANIYYNQPMLGLMEHEFGSHSGVSYLASATQLGYAVGLLLLVPLGDTCDRRVLILWQAFALILALAAAAIAPNVSVLIAASIAIGAASTIAQQIIPMAAELAPPETRGQVVGKVMSGLLMGILLARTLSGFVGEYAGWRVMFGVGALLVIGMAALLFRSLPRRPPPQRHAYLDLLRSLLDIFCAQPTLRRAMLIQALLFGSFGAFWNILALFLQGPAFHLGSDIAGLFGVLGIAGVVVAPRAGRVADKHGPHGIIRLGVLLVLAAFALFGLLPNLVGLTIGVILLDAGVQMSLVANQSIIFALNPAARSRINTVFMTGMFIGGGLGSAAASWLWKAYGWSAVAGLGAGFAGLALAYTLLATRARTP